MAHGPSENGYDLRPALPGELGEDPLTQDPEYRAWMDSVHEADLSACEAAGDEVFRDALGRLPV